jgi:hypothetical protein
VAQLLVTDQSRLHTSEHSCTRRQSKLTKRSVDKYNMSSIILTIFHIFNTLALPNPPPLSPPSSNSKMGRGWNNPLLAYIRILFQIGHHQIHPVDTPSGILESVFISTMSIDVDFAPLWTMNSIHTCFNRRTL